MKRLFISLATITIFSLFFFSCYYDNEEALYPTLSNVCDTANVTYSGTITTLLSSNCTVCHAGSAASGGISLTSYAGVQTVASSGQLMNALKGKGVPLMPASGALSQCKITQFQIWIRNGMLNN